MSKRDYMAECNNLQVSLEDFAQQFCARCLQPECSRSRHGMTKFEDRISNWQERLFAAPPRMEPTDPRLDQIRSKRFLEILPASGLVPEIRSAWLDPQDLAKSVEPPAPPPPPVQEGASQNPMPPPVQEAAPSTVAPPSTAAPVAPVAVALQNTPFRQGQMIGGKTPPAEKPPVYDPWSEPKSGQTDGVRIVKPGARIKLGG